MKRFIYNLIRRVFWKSYDPDEDFTCGYCGKEMFRRFLFCSHECALYFEEE